MPPRSIKDTIDEEQALATAVGRMISVTKGREEQMETALWDLALGHAVLLPYGAKPPQGVTIENVTVMVNDEPESIRVYLRPPDPAILKLLIEQNVGRPGSRYAKEREQAILVMHAVPGWDEEDDEEIREVARVQVDPREWETIPEVNPWPVRQ